MATLKGSTQTQRGARKGGSTQTQRGGHHASSNLKYVPMGARAANLHTDYVLGF